MKIPKIFILFAIIAGVYCVFLPSTFLRILIGGCVVLLVLVQLFITYVGQDIPSSAVRELLDRCKTESSEWVLVRFKPEVSLDEAQKRLGKEYSQDAREKGFMFKLTNVYGSRPDIVVFYSKKKGLLCGNTRAIKSLLQKYGRFMMDNWNCLLGALKRNGLNAQDLTGGQLFSTEFGYMGNVDD